MRFLLEALHGALTKSTLDLAIVVLQLRKVVRPFPMHYIMVLHAIILPFTRIALNRWVEIIIVIILLQYSALYYCCRLLKTNNCVVYVPMRLDPKCEHGFLILDMKQCVPLLNIASFSLFFSSKLYHKKFT